MCKIYFYLLSEIKKKFFLLFSRSLQWELKTVIICQEFNEQKREIDTGCIRIFDQSDYQKINFD